MITWIISMKVHRGPHVDWKSDQNCLFPSSNNIHLHFAKALGATKCTSVTLIHGTCSGQKHVSSYDTSKGLTRACVCSCLAHSWSYLEKTFPWKPISGAAWTPELTLVEQIGASPAAETGADSDPTHIKEPRAAESSLVSQALADLETHKRESMILIFSQ